MSHSYQQDKCGWPRTSIPPGVTRPLSDGMDTDLNASLPGFDWRRVIASAGTTGVLDEALLPAKETDRKEVLLAFAEVDHRLYGNRKCDVCHAPVRAAMRTIGIDDHGHTWEYACLCRRCHEAERAFCRKVICSIGSVVFDEFVNQKELVARPAPEKKKVAA